MDNLENSAALTDFDGHINYLESICLNLSSGAAHAPVSWLMRSQTELHMKF